MTGDTDEQARGGADVARRRVARWPRRIFRDGGDPRRPFSAVRYWLPGFLLAVVVGAGCLVVAVVVGDVGWATLGIPLSIGAFFGYGFPGRVAIPTAILGTVAFAAAVTAASAVGPTGVFCGAVLGFIGSPIAFVGVVIGWLLRKRLRRSQYYWARFLPLLLAAVLAGPGAALEAWLSPPNPVVEVTTAVVVDAPPETLWHASLFADAESAPPSALTHAGLPAPSRNAGSLRAVGDTKTVPLGAGLVRLRVTRADAPSAVEYAVVEQRHFEDRTARLVGGSMRLTRRADGFTQVTLSTRYEPLLGARAVWGPIERFVAEQLHAHVLREVERVAAKPRTAPAMPSDALDQ